MVHQMETLYVEEKVRVWRQRKEAALWGTGGPGVTTGMAFDCWSLSETGPWREEHWKRDIAREPVTTLSRKPSRCGH